MSNTTYFVKTKTFHSGEVIFEEGDDPSDGVYLIKEGSVDIMKRRDGQSIVIARLEKNAIFGEMALMDQKSRSATAIAASPVQCSVISVKDFEQRIENLEPFLRGVFRILTRNARETSEQMAFFYTNFFMSRIDDLTNNQDNRYKGSGV